MINLTAAYVPPIPDTTWTPYGDIFTAPATDSFWRLYRVGKGDLYDIGIRCTREGSEWLAVYTPGKATPEQIERVLVKVDDEAVMNDAAIARERERIAEEKRLKAEQKERDDQEWVRRADARHLENKDYVIGVMAEGRALLSKWKAFVVKPDRMRELTAPEWLDRLEFNELERLINRTRTKESEYLSGYSFRRRGLDPVPWPDDVVARSVRFLTACDNDQAALANDAGWSKSDTSAGHFCCVLLDTDFDLAVKKARRFVGRYEGQLRKAGIL